MNRNRSHRLAALALGALALFSSCTMDYIMHSPHFMGDDPVGDRKEREKQVAEMVKRLREPMHTGFFGEEAESKRIDAAWDLGHDLDLDVEALVALPDLVKALEDANVRVRGNASASLWNLADNSKVVEPIREAMHDPKVEAGLRGALDDYWMYVRLNAVRALVDLNAPAKYDAESLAAWRTANASLVGVLYEVGMGPDLDDAMNAADLAVTLGAHPRDVVPYLMRGVDDYSAAKILFANLAGQPADIAYLPVLLVGARSIHPDFRASSLNLLGAATYRSPQIQALLADAAASDGSSTVRVNAIQSLVVGRTSGAPGTVLGPGLGPENPSIALLLQLLHDPDEYVRAMAATTLGYTNSPAPQVVNAYIETLYDADANTRRAAADALYRLGTEGKAAAPALRAIWEANKTATKLTDRDGDPDSVFVDDVRSALVAMGEKPDAAPLR